LGKSKIPSKKENKKEKQEQEQMLKFDIKKNLSLAEVKEMFPNMHTRDALIKLAFLRSVE